MNLNVENLNTLIAHLEAQPPERINMFHAFATHDNCGCILHHALLVFPQDGCKAFDPDGKIGCDLYTPEGFFEERFGVRRYPAHRVIATLKRLLAHYLATGKVKVDWGPEPGDEPAQPWSAPQAVEIVKPALPPELTDLLRAPQPADLAREG